MGGAERAANGVIGLIVEIQSGSVCYIGGSDLLPPPLTRDEEEEMMQRMMQSDPKARSALIEHNLRLVVYMRANLKTQASA